MTCKERCVFIPSPQVAQSGTDPTQATSEPGCYGITENIYFFSFIQQSSYFQKMKHSHAPLDTHTNRTSIAQLCISSVFYYLMFSSSGFLSARNTIQHHITFWLRPKSSTVVHFHYIYRENPHIRTCKFKNLQPQILRF